MTALPPMAITMGDPAGIGPELCLQLLQKTPRELGIIPVIVGDAHVLADAAKVTGNKTAVRLLAGTPTFSWTQFVQSSSLPHETILIDMAKFSSGQIVPGKVCAKAGQAAFDYVVKAIELCQSRLVSGMVTGPIHKEALHVAGVPFPGHTEILAEYTQADPIVMMLTAPEITCALVTAHVGLHEVPTLVTEQRVRDTIRLTAAAMQQIKGRPPRLTVCGLNPHAGEQGLFGLREEELQIIPAVEWAQQAGIDIRGPLPPDTAFLPANRRVTDAYICMYHDQGLIPLKALAFDEAVNVTLGLPIVRTSVDHGTAFDIAWHGKATASSLYEAIQLAVRLVS